MLPEAYEPQHGLLQQVRVAQIDNSAGSCLSHAGAQRSKSGMRTASDGLGILFGQVTGSKICFSRSGGAEMREQPQIELPLFLY
jgi:hypothetical protein